MCAPVLQFLCCVGCNCIPCAFSWYAPCGDYYLKIGNDCGPCCIVPNEDGSAFGDGCFTTYKKAEGGAPPTPTAAEMTR